MSYYIDRNGNKIVSSKNQVKGQYSFEFEGPKVSFHPPKDEEEKDLSKKNQVVAYYDAYLEMLERYGTFNRYYALWLALDTEFPSVEAISVLSKYYGGSMGELEGRLAGARRQLKRAITSVNGAMRDLLLQSPDVVYDEAYREKERREKFRAYLRSERTKYATGKTTEIYTPEDLETRYQHWRATKKTRSKGSRSQKD